MTRSNTVSAELIAVGDEVLGGFTINTNAAWLAQELATVGVHVQWHLAVGDRIDHIVQAMATACGRASVVVVSGGLGPTPDDLTREASAALAGQPLVERPLALAHMRKFFKKLCRPMSPANLKQALFPKGARLLRNPLGTALGFSVEYEGVPIYFVPGVPDEMKGMTPAVLADIVRRIPEASPRHVVSMRTFGIGESDLAQRLGTLLHRTEDPSVGTYVTLGIITVRITGTRRDQVEKLAGKIRRILKEFVFTCDERAQEEVVVNRLMECGRTLAIAESCTGGLTAELVTRVSGSSKVFLEGAVVYTNVAKVRRCGVPEKLIAEHGAVSERVAEALARGIRETSGADIGIGITGIAGPTGGTKAKPVGLVFVGLADEKGTVVKRCQFIGSRERIRMRSAQTALDMVLKRLAT